MIINENSRYQDGSWKNPRDVEIDRIVDRLVGNDDDNAGAWRHYKHARSELAKARYALIGYWKCKLFWHASRPITQIDTKNGRNVIKICRRCGAWRGDW